tara:strand:- start:2623 stop:3375 length:753 start_codon:yes stop_codon:yes gene_type:complete
MSTTTTSNTSNANANVRTKKSRGSHKRKAAAVDVVEAEEGELTEIAEPTVVDADAAEVSARKKAKREANLAKTVNAIRSIGLKNLPKEFFDVSLKLYNSIEEAKKAAPAGIACIRLYKDETCAVDPEAPADRTQSAYLRFCGDRRVRYKGMGFREVTQRLGADWAELPATERKVYEDAANERKAALALEKAAYVAPDGYERDGRLRDAIPRSISTNSMKRAQRGNCNSIRAIAFVGGESESEGQSATAAP